MAHLHLLRLQFRSSSSSSSLFTTLPLPSNTLFSPFAYSSPAPPPPPTLASAPRKHILSFKVTFQPFSYSLHSHSLTLLHLFFLTFSNYAPIPFFDSCVNILYCCYHHYCFVLNQRGLCLKGGNCRTTIPIAYISSIKLLLTYGLIHPFQTM